MKMWITFQFEVQSPRNYFMINYEKIMNIEDKFINLLLEKLPEDKVTELEILMEVGDRDRIQEFIAILIPVIEEIISDNPDKI